MKTKILPIFLIFISTVVAGKNLFTKEFSDKGSQLIETARQFVIETSPNKRFIDMIAFQYYGTMKTPVLPDLNLIIFKTRFKGFVFPGQRYPNYECVGVDTIKKIQRVFNPDYFDNPLDTITNVTIAESLACEKDPPYTMLNRKTQEKDYDELKLKMFNEFVDTADITKINNEREAEDYARFVLTALYQQAVLKENTDEWILLYLQENLPDSLQNYMPKAAATPEGYSVVIYGYPDMYGTHPLDLIVYKHLLRIKRNGFILELSGKDRLPVHKIKETYSPLAGKKKLKPFVEARFSDSLAVRKRLNWPLPKFPEVEAKDKVVTSLKLAVNVKTNGTIFGYPIILKTTGSEWWDCKIITLLKEKWRWEESDSETYGTITIKFDWMEKK